MTVKKFEGCGDHGVAKSAGEPRATRFTYDAWCLKCNPLPDPRPALSPGQRSVRKGNVAHQQARRERLARTKQLRLMGGGRRRMISTLTGRVAHNESQPRVTTVNKGLFDARKIAYLAKSGGRGNRTPACESTGRFEDGIQNHLVSPSSEWRETGSDRSPFPYHSDRVALSLGTSRDGSKALGDESHLCHSRSFADSPCWRQAPTACGKRVGDHLHTGENFAAFVKRLFHNKASKGLKPWKKPSCRSERTSPTSLGNGHPARPLMPSAFRGAVALTHQRLTSIGAKGVRPLIPGGAPC